MIRRPICEGDLVWIYTMDEKGFIGIELLDSNKGYLQSQQPYLKSKYIPKYYQKTQNIRNLALTALFLIDNPETKGSPVRYGSNIRIIQVSSQQALSLGESFYLDQSTRKVEFSNQDLFLCSQSWTIVPQFQFRKEGEQIYEYDSIIIRSQDHGTLIIDQEQIGVSYQEQQAFKIKIFKKLNENYENGIAAQDMLLFYNIDMNAYLACIN